MMASHLHFVVLVTHNDKTLEAPMRLLAAAAAGW